MKNFKHPGGVCRPAAWARTTRALGFLSMLALATGCISEAAATSTSDASMSALMSKSGRVRAELAPGGAGIARGANDVRVTFVSTSSSAPDVELVSASAFMPAHGHASDAPTITKVDGGYELKNLTLFMAGRWTLTLNLKVDGADDTVEVELDVP